MLRIWSALNIVLTINLFFLYAKSGWNDFRPDFFNVVFSSGMKKVFQTLLYFISVSGFLFSCSPDGSRNDSQSTNDYSADTAKVNRLLDTFILYMDSNLISKTLPYAESAYALAEKINYEDGMAEALSHLRIYYSTIGDYPKAMNYILRALAINEKNNNIKKIAHNTMNIGMIHYHQKNYNEAIR